MPETRDLPQSGFCECLQLTNHLDVVEWMFEPGMLFQSSATWWGDRGNRLRPHEGLDLRLFRTSANRVASLPPGSLIPALYNGEVVRIINDFLGRTIFVRHRQHGSAGRDLYTVYGHVEPRAALSAGVFVNGGEGIAHLATRGKGETGPPPHLHLTASWITLEVDALQLDWKLMGRQKEVSLVDPLSLIGCRYALLHRQI